MKKMKKLLSIILMVAMCVSLIGTTVVTADETERAVGENMFTNPSFENGYTGWSTPSAGISTSASVSGTTSYLTNTKYSVVPYQAQTLTAGTKYLVAYNVRTSPDTGTLTTTAPVDYWFEPKTSSSLQYDVGIYEDGIKLNQTAAATGSAYAGGRTLDHNWKLVEHVVNLTSGQASFWFGAIEWANNNRFLLYDDMFLSELQSSGVKITDSDGAVSAVFDGSNPEFDLSAQVVNQLGSPAGFEDITEFTWASDSEKITVEEDGWVTVAEDIEDGTYYITATAQTTANGVTKTESGSFALRVSNELYPSSLTVTGASDIEYDKTVLSYTSYVPVKYNNDTAVYTLPDSLPEVSAEIESDKYTLDIEQATSIPGSATVRIMDGTVEARKYTVNFQITGVNLLANPGFEAVTGSEADGWSVNGVYRLKGVTTESSNTGSTAAVTSTNYTTLPWQNITLSANKRYLASYWARLKPDSTATTSTAAIWAESRKPNTSSATDMVYYSGGNVTPTWTKSSVIFTAATNDTVVQFAPTDWNNATPEVLVDDMYLGELVSPGIKITNSENETSVTIEPGFTELNLGAYVMNQLGGGEGFEDITEFTWSSSTDKITVDEGWVTVSDEIELGTYTISAEANVTVNNIGKVKGTFVIDVVDGAFPSEITVDGGLIFDYDRTIKNYTVKVPVKMGSSVDDFSADFVPTVSAQIESNNYTLSIVQADEVPGTATVSVMADGIETNKYTINFVTVGQNIYTNGSFEAYDPSTEQPSGWSLAYKNTEEGTRRWYTTKTEQAHTGLRSYFANPWYGDLLNQTHALDSNTLYLASYWVKKQPGVDPYTQYHRIESRQGAANPIAVKAYIGDELSASSSGTNAGGAAYDITDNWTQLQAVVEPSVQDTTVVFGYLGWDKTQANYYLDDMYLGQLVIGDISAGKTMISTKDGAVSEVLNFAALNQLGTTAGLESDVVAVTVDSFTATEGISFDSDTMTISASQGASGSVTFNLKAVPTSKWRNAPQKEFVKTLTIELVPDNSFFMERDSTGADLSLNYANSTGAAQNVVLYYGIYEKDAATQSYTLKSAAKTEYTLDAGERLDLDGNSAIRITASEDELIRAFLWTNDGKYTPVVKKIEK